MRCDGHRPRRGHRRLRRGLRARGAGRPAALLQDARAPVLGRRRPPPRGLRRRGGVGQGDQARAPDPAAGRVGLGRGVAAVGASERVRVRDGRRAAGRRRVARRGRRVVEHAARRQRRLPRRRRPARDDRRARRSRARGALADLSLPAPAGRRRAAPRRGRRAQRALAEHGQRTRVAGRAPVRARRRRLRPRLRGRPGLRGRAAGGAGARRPRAHGAGAGRPDDRALRDAPGDRRAALRRRRRVGERRLAALRRARAARRARPGDVRRRLVAVGDAAPDPARGVADHRPDDPLPRAAGGRRRRRRAGARRLSLLDGGRRLLRGGRRDLEPRRASCSPTRASSPCSWTAGDDDRRRPARVGLAQRARHARCGLAGARRRRRARVQRARPSRDRRADAHPRARAAHVRRAPDPRDDEQDRPDELADGPQGIVVGGVLSPWRLRGGHRRSPRPRRSGRSPSRAGCASRPPSRWPRGRRLPRRDRDADRGHRRAARRRFGRYWRLIGPFSSITRREMLAAIRRRAEA